MGGGASKKAKKSKVETVEGLDLGSDDLSVADMAKQSRTSVQKGAPSQIIKPLWDGQATPDLPKTYSESLQQIGGMSDSPPDDDGDSGLPSGLAKGSGGGNPSTPPSFSQMDSSWDVAPSPARALGGEEGGLFAGEATDIGGRKENQDQSFGAAILGGKFWVGGVFDGHGAEGKAAATYGRDRVQMVLTQRAAELAVQPDVVIAEAFKAAHSGMCMATDCTYSGTTAVCAVVGQGRVTVGWVGDSRCLVGSRNGDDCKGLTTDHRPELATERQRVEESGGLVRNSNGKGPMRVYGGSSGAVGLMLTRSLGDVEMHEYGVSAGT